MRPLRINSVQNSFKLLLPAIRLPSGVGRKNSRSLHVTRVARPLVAAVDMSEKAQVVNRDISSAVIRWYIQQQNNTKKKKKKRRHGTAPPPSAAASPLKLSKNGISILEAMSATGLRAIRYAKEIDGIGTIVANDLDNAAVESIQRNVEFNEVQSIVQPHRDDARVLMLQNPEKFDVVDIDPYGAPSELLDSAVQSVKNDGLLMVTATDMAVLCGNHAETCFTKYGSYSLHKDFHHEQAFRILLACISTHAARHKRVIEPVLCMSIDFYIRPVGTHIGGNTNKFQVGKGPAVPSACPISTGKFHMGGPIWNLPTFNPSAVEAILTDLEENSDKYPAHNKLQGMLSCVEEELHDVPLYYTLTGLARTLKVDTLNFDKFRNAIVNAGYRMSGTHCNPNGLKTDAPPEVVWDIMRCWAKQKVVKAKDPTTYQAKILAVEPEHQADFKKASGVYSKARAAKKARFVQNPDNWGPRRKHGRPMMEHEVERGDDQGENTGADGNGPNKRARVEATSEAAEGRTDAVDVKQETADVKGETAEVKVESVEAPQDAKKSDAEGTKGLCKR